MPRFALSLALLISLLLGQSIRTAWSHEGHDHGPAPAPLAKKVAPRAEASSEAFEIVAVARGGDLVVYLDRFASNEPVEGASIEIENRRVEAGERRRFVSDDERKLHPPGMMGEDRQENIRGGKPAPAQRRAKAIAETSGLNQLAVQHARRRRIAFDEGHAPLRLLRSRITAIRDAVHARPSRGRHCIFARRRRSAGAVCAELALRLIRRCAERSGAFSH